MNRPELDPASSTDISSSRWPVSTIEKCDICEVEDANGRVVSAEDFQAIFAAGYNPYHGRRSWDPLYVRGYSETGLLDGWREITQASSAAWEVCDQCADEIAPFLLADPASAAASFTAASAPAGGTGENPVCPQCHTISNRAAVIRELRRQSPLIFDFGQWTTSFVCVGCGAELTISGTRAEGAG